MARRLRYATALFGRNVGTRLARSILIVAVVGGATFIVIGLLRPNSAPPTTSDASVDLQVGDRAPNFTLTALDGKQMSLSDLRGKPVMLNYWYASCPGCLAEIPGMQQFYAAQQAGRGFVIPGVNSVDDAQTAQQFVQQDGWMRSVPTIVFPDGSILVESSARELAAKCTLDPPPTLGQRIRGLLQGVGEKTR
jgi:hypothetical protein